MQNLIELKEVGKSFYKAKKLSFRLKNINLKVTESQLIIVKGPNGSGKTTLIFFLIFLAELFCPNGSGKTTLLKILKKISLPDHGKIIFSSEINEKDISLQASNENTFFPRLTARENLEFFLGMKGYSLEESYKLFGAFCLSKDILNSRFFNLSLGEKKKLSLIRAFIGQPKIILLDEPTVSLDIPSRAGLIRIIKSYRELGTIFIVATHEHDLFEGAENSVIEL